MIFEGLLSPYVTGTERPQILYDTALARIRQLSAHEVGHTLGLGHNYYSSGKGWISVMDYPHPLRGAEARRHHRHQQGLPGAHRRLGQGGDQLRVSRIRQGHRRGRGAAQGPGRRLGGRPALLHQPGHGYPPAQRPVVERREPGRRARPRHEDPPRRARSHGRIHDPHARADDDDRRAAGADLHAPSLRGREQRVDGRRPGFHVCHARRRPHADQVGLGSRSAQGARGARRDAEAVRADASQEAAGPDSAAAPRLRHAPRAVHPSHRRGLRSDRAGPRWLPT